MDSIVSELQSAAEKKWFSENDIQPPLPIGTRIKQGVIAGIYEHGPAMYLVKEDGCTKDGRHLIIKFENAHEVTIGA